MKRIVASIFVGLCLFLGNISSQAKSYQIVGHISAEHSHHHSEHGKSHKHQHTIELSFATVYLALPSLNGFVSIAPLSISSLTDFYAINVLNQLSFSPPVFRPPIV